MADWRDTCPKLSDLEELYFRYLVDLVDADKGYGDTYIELCRCLHKIEYHGNMSKRGSNTAKEDSIAVDGEYLRCDFGYEMGWEGVREALPFHCTWLEFLIAKAQRRDFLEYDAEKGSRISEFFWEFLEKMCINFASDEVICGEKCKDVMQIRKILSIF